MRAITRHVSSEEFTDAGAGAPRRVRWRPGAAFLLATATPRVNPAAWFALAVAVPLALLALAAGMTQAGAPRVAGLCVALLLAPAVVLALRSLEVRQGDATPAQTREQDLVRAFCLTTGQACGFLFTVILGAPFSGESVAVGLAMAGVPLTLAVVSDLWRRVFRPLDERLAPPKARPAQRDHTWTLEWIEARREEEAEGYPVTPMPVVQPRPRPDAPVTLTVDPVAPDEAWMRRATPVAAADGWMRGGARRPMPIRQNGSGWTSGSTQPRRAEGVNNTARVQ